MFACRIYASVLQVKLLLSQMKRHGLARGLAEVTTCTTLSGANKIITVALGKYLPSKVCKYQRHTQIMALIQTDKKRRALFLERSSFCALRVALVVKKQPQQPGGLNQGWTKPGRRG